MTVCAVLRRPKLVLASASPRRRELLVQIGVTPDEVAPVQVDENALPREKPVDYVRRVAAEKATAAIAGPMASNGDTIVLSADTTVAVGRRILGKPRDQTEARRFLNLLSGRRHRVLTAVIVAKNTTQERWTRLVDARVKFKRLSRDEIEWYVATGEWRDKAGGYGVQGAAAAFIPWISGSYTAIVGLPVAETAALLSAAGYGNQASK